MKPFLKFILSCFQITSPYLYCFRIFWTRLGQNSKKKKSSYSAPVHLPKCVLMWKAQAATLWAWCDSTGAGVSVPRSDQSDIPVSLRQCKVFLKIILCSFKINTTPPAPLKQDLKVICAECAFLPDYCICNHEHPGVKNRHTHHVWMCVGVCCV